MGEAKIKLCSPWRAELSFENAELRMTVRTETQRRFVHQFIRIYGGGPRNGGCN